MSNIETMSKPDVDEMMKNEQTDDFNTLHLKDFAKARLEIQEADIQQNGFNDYQKYKYTKLEDMIVIVEPILLKYNLVSNFTEVEHVAGNKFTEVTYRMRIIHTVNRQYFESFVTLYHNKDSKDVGTNMTYARRYLYESIIMMRGTPDDDAGSDKPNTKQKNNNNGYS